MDNLGWIKLHRKILRWEWYDDKNTFLLFIHLLLTVNYETKKWQGITIERGQIVTSIKHLAKSTRQTPSQIRTSLQKLQNTQNLAIKTTNKFTLITVVNYNNYQDQENEIANKIANGSQTNRKQIATTKEYKKDKNIKNIIHDQKFSEFWSLYPRKISRGVCEKKYSNYQGQHDEIIKGLKQWNIYWKQKGTETQYIPHATTWLNQERWKDSPIQQNPTFKASYISTNSL